MFVRNQNAQGFSVKAWQGDAKTLLAFNFDQASDAKNLAGFSIEVQPHGKQSYFLLNMLSLPAGKHAVMKSEPANSTANAPIQKFRWLHVPGQFHQGENVFYGVYKYIVTPRYFKSGLLAPLDASLSVSVEINVESFAAGHVEVGFTRGFTQSQAFVNHFGPKAPFRPKGKDLLFDTKAAAGKNALGQSYTFDQEYEWSGFTARDRVFEILDEVMGDKTLALDVFAYDLNEPDVMKGFLQLAKEGRIRIILDNATLHHGTGKAEDAFETQFKKIAKNKNAIQRGKFGRFAHDKVLIVSDTKSKQAVKVLTGSTNFSVTGMYVNSNHVLVFDNPEVATLYSKVFAEAWTDKVSQKFSKSSLAKGPFAFNQKGLPKMSISFSPHPTAVAQATLDGVAATINNAKSSVLFAVMDLATGSGPVFPALQAVHKKQSIFSYGISDNPGDGISLYKPGQQDGVLVTGKPGETLLPPPFDKEMTVGLGHQIHHKFVICDFAGEDPIVWCGSSNLALGGEEQNGDNLLEIHDADLAAVFAIEAVGLVDHFDFRNRHAKGNGGSGSAPTAPKGGKAKPPTTKPASTTLHLYDSDTWANRYFDRNDLYFSDRVLFG